MIATSAKLRELVEAASPEPWEADTVLAIVRKADGYEIEEPEDLRLAAAAPVLARLVLDLSEELEKFVRDYPKDHPSVASADAAIAAVEKLEL